MLACREASGTNGCSVHYFQLLEQRSPLKAAEQKEKQHSLEMKGSGLSF